MTESGIDLTAELDSTKKDLRAAQEMLFLVLQAVGDPVFIPDEDVARGLGRDRVVEAIHDEQQAGWTVELGEVDG